MNKNTLSVIKDSTTLRKTAWLCIGAFIVSLLGPGTVQGQLGISSAAILAFLQSMQTTMQQTMAVPLTAIQGVEQQEASFQQTAIYPMSEMTSAQGLSSRFSADMQSMQSTMTNPSPSAIPGTAESTLEASTLSGNPGEIANIPAEYANVYGPTPPATAFSNPKEASAIDMGDAQAKDALSKSVQLDAVSASEMTAANQLMQEAQTDSAGTSPMVQAQASALVLQSQAYTQEAMSQMLRTRSAELSYQALDMKDAGVASENSSQAIQNVIASH